MAPLHLHKVVRLVKTNLTINWKEEEGRKVNIVVGAECGERLDNLKLKIKVKLKLWLTTPKVAIEPHGFLKLTGR